MDTLITKFRVLYKGLSDTANDYREADNEQAAEELYAKFGEIKADIEDLASEIERRWNHIVDTKYYAYGYVLESNNEYDLLDASSAEFTDMRRECSSQEGNYISDAVVHYALGRPTLRIFEHNFARTMELHEAADSIATLQRDASEIDFAYEPVNIERRLFIDYQPIIIGRTNFYKESNPIPALKVYERGTIYRILLGSFRSKQPMTLFKGVQPLYITRNEDGYYEYYAGGFATRREADDALLFLKEKGFKRPEICRWRDGEMINIDNLSKNEDDTENVAPVGSRYVVILNCSTISDALRETITSTSPDKSISRRGAQFAIGTFTDHSEADLLLSTIEEKHPEITVSIEELNF
jgi:hypothetical protein